LIKLYTIYSNTNKVLAEETGFSSTECFAKAFLGRTGMPTSYFIEELKKSNLDFYYIKKQDQKKITVL
jgi:AraC-like DNA-binding protein